MKKLLVKETYLDDAVIQQIDGLWRNLQNFSGRLTKQLDKIPPDSPILLCGEWGSGKSSVLKSIQEQLEDKIHQGKYQCVWFDAWLYEQEANLLPSLIRLVWHELKGRHDNKLFKKALCYGGAIAYRVLPFVLGNSAGAKDVAEGLKKTKISDIKADAEALSSGFYPPNSEVDELSSSFHGMINSKLKEDQQLVIFIDDLDRCNPESAVNLLDNIRLLLNNFNHRTVNFSSASIRFIVAMDKVTLTASVANKFRGLNSYEGNRYLEKLFPFVFSVPSLKLGELSDFVNKLFGQVLAQSESDNTEQIKELELVVQSLTESPFHNPRLIKRSINRFLQLHGFSEDQPIETDTSTLFLWIAASERWPMLRRLMQQKNYTFWRLMVEAVQQNQLLNDEEADELLLQKGFKDFYRKHFVDKLEPAISKFTKAEKELASYGL